MLVAERHNHIITAVRSKGSASISELADDLEVSVSTLRRDLDFLSDAGLLQRTRGGAVSHVPASKTFEPPASVSGVLASAEKRAIGQYAAQQIKSGQTVLFDSGTTTVEAARAAVALHLQFTAITNDLQIAALLSMEPGIDVIVPGGMVRSGTPTILGSTTQDFMLRLSVDLLMLGAHGAHDGRLSDTSIELANLKRCMITISEIRLLLVDSGKFERCAFAVFGNVSDFDQVITDDALSPEATASMVAQPVKVVRVSTTARRAS
ncbi:MAG: DeoR/GlpR transcriptional regulator [Rhodobacteraceae bacterium CG17_big_fil_post_rev_8_21_14_2_50_63_15]|nr:MAG: DeoR/GlpR transcriptional regulator [Rhodobacteraceae bacterium CG17_big_fil_post_rev_8_21_14_2_50_63_15]